MIVGTNAVPFRTKIFARRGTSSATHRGIASRAAASLEKRRVYVPSISVAMCSTLRWPASAASAGSTVIGTCPANGMPRRRASSASAKKASRGTALWILIRSTPSSWRRATAARAPSGFVMVSRCGISGLGPSTVGPARKMRGPTSSPLSMRARQASRTSSSPPMSRTAVTPLATSTPRVVSSP